MHADERPSIPSRYDVVLRHHVDSGAPYSTSIWQLLMATRDGLDLELVILL